MGIEIERKFLPRNDGWRAAAHKVVPMAQGYLNDLALVDSGAMQASVRVRIEGDAAFLNIKSRELGARRQEFEYPVPVAEARALLQLCVGGLVEKHRHYVEHAGHLWEVDEFLGDNAGLVVAEIELDAEDAAFTKPDWAGPEATYAQRYYNLALASRPFSQWREDERQALDLKDGHGCC
ncbi:MAG TPA: CYTH domain-containing protein [Thermomonas sp.]